MTKFLTFVVGVWIAFSLIGCGIVQLDQSCVPLSSGCDATIDTPSTIPPSSTALPMNAIALPSVKETVDAEDGTPLVSLTFQHVQVILHNRELEEKIVNDFQSRTGSVLENLSDIEAQARQNHAETEFWSEYFIDISYTPTRLDHSVLSLFGNTSSYSSGAHPSLVTDSVTYDLQTGDKLCLDDILTPECTPDAIYQLVLKSLEDQADDLYYDYADAIGDRFTGELHAIQDWYFSRSGLCFHFAPYDIAPYSSGTVIAELPYGTLTGILREKYFPTPPTTATGSMYVEPCIEDDSERFSFIADVNLNTEGNELLLYPDATVTDIRIETGIRNSETNQYIANGTVFAANTMNIGDAIRLTGNLSDSDSLLRLVYHSGGQTYSAFITYDSVTNSYLLTNG